MKEKKKLEKVPKEPKIRKKSKESKKENNPEKSDLENQPLTEEMQEEGYVEPQIVEKKEPSNKTTSKKVTKTQITLKMPETKDIRPIFTKKRVLVKPKTQTKIEPNNEDKLNVTAPEETWLFEIDNIYYWSSDEDFKNGFIFEYIVNEEGDGAPGKAVGKLVNGGVCLNM